MNIVCLMSSMQLGGAERQLLGLAHILQDEGHKVEVLTYHKASFYSPAAREYALNHHFIDRRGSLAGFIFRMSRHLDEFGCDALISFKAGCSLKACLLKLLRPEMRLFVSERNFNIRYLPHDAFRFFCFRIAAEKVICNNHSQEAFIRKHYPKLSHKVLTISNFIDTVRFCPDPSAVTGGQKPHIPRRIVVTARVSSRKNMRGLILAADLLKKKSSTEPDFVIDWYGMSRDSAYLRKMLAIIHSKGLGDVFRIHSATPDVVSCYRNADIFCLPSFYEGTSNSLAEALSCGNIAVCSRVSDNPLYVHEGENGFLCNPYSPQSIADALDRAMALDPDAYSRACAASRRIVTDNLSIKDFTQAYLKILK